VVYSVDQEYVALPMFATIRGAFPEMKYDDSVKQNIQAIKDKIEQLTKK
jgi:hypothetical protein